MVKNAIRNQTKKAVVKSLNESLSLRIIRNRFLVRRNCLRKYRLRTRRMLSTIGLNDLLKLPGICPCREQVVQLSST
jgi:hypothetical protein